MGRSGRRAVAYPIAALVLIIQVYPIFWILTSSLKTSVDFTESNPFALPSTLYLGTYREIIGHSAIFKYLFNNILVTVCSVAAVAALSCAAGFAIEKYKLKFGKIALGIFLTGMMIPIQVTLIPLFMIYKKMGILNTYASLIIPQVGFSMPISIYLYSSFFRFLPNDILESVVIDGGDIYTIFSRIAVPVSVNTMVTVVIINSVFIWNDFIFANTFISRDAIKTLSAGLMDFIGDRGKTDWGATFTAISISILPILLGYFVLNQRIITSLTTGIVKE